MIEDLIGRVFKARNASHGAHWKTNSYAQHQALGDFYDEIISTLDKYVEAHQSLFGLVEKTPDQVSNITDALKKDVKWVSENREKIAQNIPALENIIDELTAVYLKTLYKLENLR